MNGQKCEKKSIIFVQEYAQQTLQILALILCLYVTRHIRRSGMGSALLSCSLLKQDRTRSTIGNCIKTTGSKTEFKGSK